MIITRTPFRISFCGGGSDLPAFYKKHGGCVLSATIDKYMYLSVHPSFLERETILKYSETEIVRELEEIRHPYFRAVLKEMGIRGVEITSTADIPAGTGLGSSSAFTVGLFHTLYSYTGKFVSKERLADKSCRLEIEELKQPVGKQDPYASAYGGINFFNFNRDGSVFTEPVLLSEEVYRRLENSLMMFYVGGAHSASEILKRQMDGLSDKKKEQSQMAICDLSRELRRQLQSGRTDGLGDILHQGWILKREMAPGITNERIDAYYERALQSGARGGKLLGAGGGGFLLLYVGEDKKDQVREALRLPEMPFRFEGQGSAVIFVGQKPRRIKKRM